MDTDHNEILKQDIARVAEAIDVGIEQLNQNQVIDGAASREKMMQKLATLAKR